MPHLTDRLCFLFHSRVVTAWISALLLLLQRSPVAKLLLEVKERTPTGFADIFRWSVATVSGLGAYNSVAGATVVSQLTPSAGSAVVPVTAGLPLSAVFQATGSNVNPAVFEITGVLPVGLVQGNLLDSSIETVSGVTTQLGDFPVTITAWRFSIGSGDFVTGNFTFRVVNPPLPAITQQPTGGNFLPGGLALMVTGHTNGQNFTWNRNGQALPLAEHFLVSKSSPRRFLVPSLTVNPYPANEWRSGNVFDDSTWTMVSGGIGYDTNPSDVSYASEIAVGGDLRTAMFGNSKSTSAYVRVPFEISAPGRAFSFLRFRHQSDDGFVAFLNGVEIAKRNSPSPLAFNSAATSDATPVTIAYSEINVSQHLGLLRMGQNLLAVHALNRASSGNDFLFNCELVAGINASNSQRLVLSSLSSLEAGNYTVTVSNPAGSVTSSPPAVISLPDPLNDWKIAKFTIGEQSNPLVSGPDADPDGDGLPNLLEFALGREPKIHDSSAALRPQSEVPVGGGANRVVLRVAHVADLGSVTLRFQTSPVLSPAVWTEVVNGVNGAQVTDQGGELLLSLPQSAETLFVRLVASQP